MKLLQFLRLVPSANWRGNPPAVWNAELRESLSDNLVKVGWGGKLELTPAGRLALEQNEKEG